MVLRFIRPNKAFSLLEILIVVGLLSIGIMAVIKAFSFAANVAGLSCDMVYGVHLAQDTFQELEFREQRKAFREGLIEEAGKRDKFQWHYIIRSEPEADLRNLSLKVVWQRTKKQECLDLSSYLML